MRKIIIDIDAGERECGECERRCRGTGRCEAFKAFPEWLPNDPPLGEAFFRLPACLSAEAKLKRLVEAAKNIVEWCDKNDWGCVPGKIESSIRAALKEIEHE